MQDFRKLEVWEKSHHLTLGVYEATKGFPREELFGLTSQIRRSCASIPMNIAEGCGRRSSSEFSQFLQIAMGSARELEYQLLLVHDLHLLATPEYKLLDADVCEVKRMLTSLILKVRQPTTKKKTDN